MKTRAVILGLTTAGSLLPLCNVAGAVDAVAPVRSVQSGPRIIHVPEQPPNEPKRDATEPHKKPEPVKPPLSQRPAAPSASTRTPTAPSPSARTPAAPKSNRKIWI